MDRLDLDPDPWKLCPVHVNFYKEKSNTIITLGNVCCPRPYQTTWLQLLQDNNQLHYHVERHEIQGLLHRLRELGGGGIAQSDLNSLVAVTLKEWKQRPRNGKYKVHLVTKSFLHSWPVPVPIPAQGPAAMPLPKLTPRPGLVVVREKPRVVGIAAREEPQKMVQVEPPPLVREKPPPLLRVEPLPSTSRQAFGNENRGLSIMQVEPQPSTSQQAFGGVGMEVDDPRPPSRPLGSSNNNQVMMVLPPRDQLDRLTPNSEKVFMYSSPRVVTQQAKEDVRRRFLPHYLQPQTTRKLITPAQVVQQHQVNVQARPPVVAVQPQAPPQVAPTLAQAQQQGPPLSYRLVNNNILEYQGGHFRIIPQPQNGNYNGYNQNHHEFANNLVYQPLPRFPQAAPQPRRVTVTPPSPAAQAVDMRPQNPQTRNDVDPTNGTDFFLNNNKFL